MSRTDFLVSWVGIDYDDSLPAQRFRRLDVRWHNWRWQPLGLERVSMGIRFSIKATFLQLLEHPTITSYVLGSLSTAGYQPSKPRIRSD